MADDPKTFQIPDPAQQPDENQDSLQGLPLGDPTGPEPFEESKPGYEAQPLAADVISEIRQSLVTEEEQSRKTTPTGNLIRRITGSLKRVTGPLGRTGPLGKTGPLPADSEKEPTLPSSVPTDVVPAEEMPDTMVSGRLEGTTISGQPVITEETNALDSFQLVPSLEEETPPVDAPNSLLDSSEAAAFDQAESETLIPESRSGWMAEIRSETVEPEERPEKANPETPPPPAEKPRGFTAPLRSFITGVLGGEGRRRPPEADIPDDLLEGRLSRSMTTGPLPQGKPPTTSQPADQETLPENAEEPRKTGVTGSLIRRVTGSLRRVTRSTGRTGPLAPQPGEEPTTSPVSPNQTARLEMPEDDDLLLGHQEELTAGEAQVLFEEPVEETPQLSGDDAISLLDSGAIAALEKAETESRISENPPEWMAEIRSETVEPEGQPGEKPEDEVSETPPPPAEKPRGFTAPLRSFITGVLGGEGRRKPPEEEMPDDLLAGRLNRSLTTGPLPHREIPIATQPAGEETPAEKTEQTGTGALRAILGDVSDDSVVQNKPVVRSPLEQRSEDRPPTGSLKKSFFADLDDEELETGQLHPDKLNQISPAPGTQDQVLPEDRFAIFDQDQPKKSTGGLIIDEPLDLTADEEQLLWGHVETPVPNEVIKPGPVKEPPMFSEEEIWGTPGEIEQPQEPASRWNKPVEITPGEIEPVDSATFYEPVTDDDYAQSFLTGSLVQRHEEAPPVNLMQQALERHSGGDIDPHNVRAIAMEGMEYEAPMAGAYPRLYGEEEEEEGAPVPLSFKAWFAKRSAIEKFLLAEGVVAILAMLIAIPFFIFVIAGGRPPSAAVVQPPSLSARPLPPDLPYPVELTLPGGWSFPLQKSTFIKGEWKPAAAEWLEGTELRRVVALPWNRQTEAVIQSFKTGDKIQVSLSNKNSLYFQVNSIDRMPARNSSIFSDLSPSLIIILYKEDSDERWVVLCQPSR